MTPEATVRCQILCVSAHSWQQTAAFHDRLATWVANTAGDDNGASPPAPIYQGSVQMGFYNMAQGDAPILRDLAQSYAISDNYHQAVQGGTGANHIVLGTGFAASYQDASGNAAKPPAGEIENPNPKPGTNNNYTQDGYGSSTTANAGGSYSECADQSQHAGGLRPEGQARHRQPDDHVRLQPTAFRDAAARDATRTVRKHDPGHRLQVPLSRR